MFILISVSAGLKGSGRFKATQLLLFLSVLIKAFYVEQSLHDFCKMDQAGSCQSMITATSHVSRLPAVTLSAFTCTASGE